MKRLTIALALAIGPFLIVPRLDAHTYASTTVAAQHIRVCGPAKPGFARCDAILVLPAQSGSGNGRVKMPKPTATQTSIPPPATATNTATATATATFTPVPPTATFTSVPPTATFTSIPPTLTSTPITPTATATNTATPASCPTPASPVPSGYGPCDLRSAYNLTSASASAGSAQTVAIVDAFDDPTAEADLGVYRTEYGLPPCTTANGCFKKVNQTGGSAYPAVDAGWAQEISLDLDMVSAICSNCKILLVEASSANFADLGTAINEAASLGANAISNSYGGSEYSSETSDEASYLNHPGIAITVSAGDSGYGVQFPAASQYVTAVGGTSLNRATNSRGWSESVWGGFFNGTGSGCSASITKPSWQHDSGCPRRTVADVAAVADPNTGVAVYDSTPYNGSSGWLTFGGTSVASPIIASVYALAGNESSLAYGSYPYSHTSSLYDVTSGSNATFGCSPAYLCTGGAGYDGPTGFGTPNGTGAF